MADLCDGVTPLRRLLESLPESELQLVVRDLLRAMKFEEVSVVHGPLEFGRDLVFAETTKLNERRWIGAQVKATPSTARMDATGLRTLITQCEAALDTPYPLRDGSSVFLDQVWIVHSHQLTEHVKLGLRGKLSSARQVVIVDGPKLHDLVQKYLPDLLLGRSAPIEAYMQNLKDFCDTPEEYLSTRFRTRTPLSECYVPPTVYLRVVLPGVLRSSYSASEASSLRLFSAKADTFEALLAARCLPLALHAEAAEIARKLVAFHHACLDCLHDERKTTAQGSAIQNFTQLLALDSAGLEISCKGGMGTAEAISKLVEEGGDPLANPEALSRLVEIIGETGARKLLAKMSAADMRLRAACATVSASIDALDASLRASYLKLASDVYGTDESPDKLIDENQVASSLRMSQLSDALVPLHSFNEASFGRLRASSPLHLLQHTSKVALIGDLGLGKSTALKRLAHRAIAQRADAAESALPVFVVLAAISAELNANTREHFVEAARHSYAGLNDRSDKEALWLLDGLDEMRTPLARKRVLDWISGGKHDDGRRIWITSRPTALTQYVPGLQRVWLEMFGPAQIEEFIAKFPWGSSSGRASLETALRGAPALAELASMPLLLTLLALLSDAQNEISLPSRREGIYDLIVRLFLGEWDDAKGVLRDHVFTSISDRMFQLTRVAHELYSLKRRTFTSDEFVTICANKMPDATTETYERADRFLKELMRDSLIIQQPSGQLAFFHLSIQE